VEPQTTTADAANSGITDTRLAVHHLEGGVLPAGRRAIAARDVRYLYGDGDDGADGLRALSLDVPYGKIFGLVGPSGSGKTTAVRLVLGLLEPQAGELSVLGTTPSKFTTSDRESIGYLPQLPVLDPNLSIEHNLHFVASLYGMPWRASWLPGKKRRASRESFRRALELVGLQDKGRTRLGDASGGEQRRLGLAAALIHDPTLLVLDEPTAGIDPVLRQSLWHQFGRLRDDGRTLLVTTQYVTEADYCDVVALVIDGHVRHIGTPAQLRRAALGDAGADATFDEVFVELVAREDRRNGGRERDDA
jgi:ABC-2 type transport system ATP-binding protein